MLRNQSVSYIPFKYGTLDNDIHHSYNRTTRHHAPSTTHLSSAQTTSRGWRVCWKLKLGFQLRGLSRRCQYWEWPGHKISIVVSMRQESSMGNLVLDHGAEWLWSGCYEVAILTINLKMLAFDLRTGIINGEAWIRLNIIQQQNMKGSSRENRKVMRDRMHVNVLCSDLNHRSFNRRLSQSLLWLKDEWMLSCYGNHDGEIP